MPVAADFRWQGADLPKKPLISGARLVSWHGNLDAIVASHQDAVLSSAQVGNADGQLRPPTDVSSFVSPLV